MTVWAMGLLMTLPALALAWWRYRWMKRRMGKRAASATMAVLMVMMGLGFYSRHRALEAYQQEDPQAFRFNSNPLVRRLFTPNAAPAIVKDEATQQEVFSYYRNDGAARLIALEHPSAHEWLATLAINISEPQNEKLKGYFEKEVTDDSHTLPLTRVYRSWGGGLRVEDVQNGQTLFRYAEASALRPVEASKTATGTGTYEWRVRFTNALGLVSQQAAPVSH